MHDADTGTPIWSTEGGAERGTAVARAASALLAGGVVAVPTETYYGLAADVRRAAAVRRVAELKGRTSDKPLLLLVAGLAAARNLAATEPRWLSALADRFWPGPLTLVLPARPDLPAEVVSRTGGVAVRHSPHPVLAALLARVGAALTGTSANPAGAPPTTDPATIALVGLDGILADGPTPGGPPSTLLDLCGERPRMLREGAIGAERLREVLGKRLL